jgi:TPR repeat protein
MWAFFEHKSNDVMRLLFLVVLVTLTLPATAFAKARHALLLGVGDYKESSGLSKLKAPTNDALQLKKALEAADVEFTVTLLKESDVKDKAAFNQALEKFLAGVNAGDEVLFYFSGHGFNIGGTSNYFLLHDAKSQQAYIKDLSAAEARQLVDAEKRDKRYQEWISGIALAESDIEKAIADRNAEVILLVTDACRSPVTGAKGLVPVGAGVTLPKEMARGTFRLYSARAGQISLDAPDTYSPSRAASSERGKDSKNEMSLFTSILVRELNGPPLEINLLAAKIKIEVRERATKLGAEQIPDYTDDPRATNFYFRRGSPQFSSGAFCHTARAELAQLRYGVAAGSTGRDVLERKRIELAPCDLAAEIESLIKLESQGGGVLSESDGLAAAFQQTIQESDPGRQCDTRASSPFDPNRLQTVSNIDIQKIALRAFSGELDRAKALELIKSGVEACTKAVGERPRVPRYKFNLARAHYALATLNIDGVDRALSLLAASQNYQEAADLGYVAAYNDLAVLHQNGEYHKLENGVATQQPRDRDTARTLYQRGADLSHIIALYNLGMAYKNGDLGLSTGTAVGGGAAQGAPTGSTAKTRDALAFQFFSKSAEGGYIPSMIQTALFLHNERGVARNAKRSIELLELAASRGSWEAMYYLGEIHRIGFMSDPAEAVVWHARAAEAGETRSQAKLARMLTDGDGLPAPQREAAGRYWRLAANGGSVDAQMELAALLRDGKVPARPRLDGAADGGAGEILELFSTAFAKGNPEAGLELARLFRKGFPEARPSKAIPKNPRQAISLLWDTMDVVRNAELSSWEAKPEIEVRAAVELISMNESGEAKGLITEDQINLLKDDYGDTSRLTYVRAEAAGGRVNCKSAPQLWVLIWNSNRADPPVERQFDWYERYYKCKEKDPEDTKTKEEELGISKNIRKTFQREYEAARKDKDKRKSYVDRMVELVNKSSEKKRR